MIDTSTLATHINGKINTIKLFLYKSYPEIFSKLDFDNDSIFCNPLLFAVFRQRLASAFSFEEERDLISGILQGYFTDREKEIFLIDIYLESFVFCADCLRDKFIAAKMMATIAKTITQVSSGQVESGSTPAHGSPGCA